MANVQLSTIAAVGAVLAACSGGSSTPPAALELDLATHAFGSVAVADQSAAATFTVRNDGGSASGVPDVSLGETASFTIVSSTCTSALPAGASCEVAVAFTPTRAGAQAATLAVAATPGGTAAASLAGTGTATVSITTTGAGSGTVSSDPAGLDCGTTCSATLSQASIALTATPAAGWAFEGWSGACSGTATCELALDGAVLEVTAEFDLLEVLVPAGSFWMGCHADDTACDAAESPYHQVSMSAFYIDRTEVTQAAYDACLAAGACTVPVANLHDLPPEECDDPDRGAYPRTCVSWVQARAFCQWLGKDLPTEAQWEKAARGTDGRIYPWGNTPPTCELSNQDGCAQTLDPAESHPSGASPYGALNMAGNAGEFVKDWWGPGYYATQPAAGPDPQGPASGVNDWYVLRAGGLAFPDASNRTSWRTGIGPKASGWATDYGFRCARTAP